MISNRFFARAKIRGGSMNLPRLVAIDQPIMHFRTTCQQYIRPFNNMTGIKRTKIQKYHTPIHRPEITNLIKKAQWMLTGGSSYCGSRRHTRLVALFQIFYESGA